VAVKSQLGQARDPGEAVQCRPQTHGADSRWTLPGRTNRSLETQSDLVGGRCRRSLPYINNRSPPRTRTPDWDEPHSAATPMDRRLEQLLWHGCHRDRPRLRGVGFHPLWDQQPLPWVTTFPSWAHQPHCWHLGPMVWGSGCGSRPWRQLFVVADFCLPAQRAVDRGHRASPVTWSWNQGTKGRQSQRSAAQSGQSEATLNWLLNWRGKTGSGNAQPRSRHLPPSPPGSAKIAQSEPCIRGLSNGSDVRGLDE